MTSSADRMRRAVLRLWALWIAPVIHVILESSGSSQRNLANPRHGTVGQSIGAMPDEIRALWHWERIVRAQTLHGNAREVPAIAA